MGEHGFGFQDYSGRQVVMNSIVVGDQQNKVDLKQCKDRSKHRNGHKKCRGRASIADSAEKILVVVNGVKEITKYALEWALTHIV